MPREDACCREQVTMPVLSGLWAWLLRPHGVRRQPGLFPASGPAIPHGRQKQIGSRLSRNIEERLIKVHSPLAACMDAPPSTACAQVFKDLKNPYYLGDEVGLDAVAGLADAWTSRPSVYAVAARTTEDVVAAVDFAREHNLRLVVKGGNRPQLPGHVQRNPNSLLIWMRKMNAITVHDAFVGAGCAGTTRPAAGGHDRGRCDLGPGLRSRTTQAGRYVQGGGCMTVCRRPDPKWRPRKLLQGLWDGGGEPAQRLEVVTADGPTMPKVRMRPIPSGDV